MKTIKCKCLGLGAPPAFLDGDNEEAILEVYQRYQLYKELINKRNTSTSHDNCEEESCPPGTHCSLGFCFCDSGRDDKLV